MTRSTIHAQGSVTVGYRIKTAEMKDPNAAKTRTCPTRRMKSGANRDHKGNPAFDTADFGYDRDNPGTDRAPGNLRTDYVLPSKTLQVENSGVYWLTKDDPLFALPEYPTSTHRMVWMDILLPN